MAGLQHDRDPFTDSEDWKRISAHDNIPAYSVYVRPILKGELDDREYRAIVLENGLRVLLVHDAKADKSAASLDVSVGHLSDPDDIPGLAHFCEHLLFMGTKQYPRENEYKEYLSKNGGSSNAGTGSDYTNYYFRVNATALTSALDRFSTFFHSPLFSPSCTLREMNAVDSENKKNLQNDGRRVYQLMKHLSKPGHVWSKFGTGNKKSLMDVSAKVSNAIKIAIDVKNDAGTAVEGTSDEGDEEDGGPAGRETRRRLIEWWTKEYCASRMSLVVVAKEPLEDLVTLTAKIFSPIPNRGQNPQPIIIDHPFGEDEVKTIVHVNAIKDTKAVEVFFPFPDTRPMWRTKPEHIISTVLGHEGPGSIFSHLKSRGWITSLSAGVSIMAHEIAVFKVTIKLTDDGFVHYRQTLIALFKAINFLRSSPPSDALYSEAQQLDSIRFRFSEKYAPDDYAQTLSKYLKYSTPRELLLSGPKLIFNCAGTEVKQLLELLDVHRCRVVLWSRDHFDAGDETGEEVRWQTEPWYGTEYTVRRLDDELLDKARLPNDIPEIHLPAPNEFIPSDFDVEKEAVGQLQRRPKLIKRMQLMEVWQKKDDQFWIPKARVTLDLRSPIACSSPRSTVLTKLYAQLVLDALEEVTYAATLASLSYTVTPLLLGVGVSISGFNDKLHVLLRIILEKMRDLQIKEERMVVIVEKLRRSWENFYLETSYTVSDYHAALTLTEHQYTYKEYINELLTVTVTELNEHVQEFISNTYARVLVVGNMHEEDALHIAEMITSTLSSNPVPESDQPQYLSRLLPSGCNYIWEIPNADPKQLNGSVTYFLHLGDIAEPRPRVTAYLLMNILKEPVFSTLRTKEQLGYIVSSTNWDDTGYIGLRIVVQSRRDTRYVERRIEMFLEGMKGVIQTMGEEQLEERRKGLIQDWTQKLKNLKEESDRFWTHIASGYLDFERKYRDAELLCTITKDEVLALFNSCVHPSSTTRSKFSVHLKPQVPPMLRLSAEATHAFIEYLRVHKITVNESGLTGLNEEIATMDEAKSRISSILPNGSDVSKELVHELYACARRYPADEDMPALGNKAEYIVGDIKDFKARLRLSDPPVPVEVNNVPLSKY